MAPGDTARLYHRLTSYSYVPEDEWPTRWLPPVIDHPLVLQDFVPVDFERLPPASKVYASGLPVIELPREWPTVPTRATAVLAGQAPAAPAPLDLTGLARVLARCSFLLDEVAVHGRQTPVRDGQVLDILPPFAGG